MTLEELRKEAEKHGYTLSKKIVYEKLNYCSCGRRPFQAISVNPNGKYYRCPYCGKKSEIARTLYQARSNWNKVAKKN